jgi:Flp pilus assembly protein protease CpaA
MSNDSAEVYSIPASFRRMENMHIIFWLLKDISWCMVWKPLGIAMIFPTLIIAIIIAYKSRNIKSELSHNLAIVFWITANSYWMISEFLGFDEKLIGGYEGKYIAVIPFLTGMVILLYYYIIQRPLEIKKHKKTTM